MHNFCVSKSIYIINKLNCILQTKYCGEKPRRSKYTSLQVTTGKTSRDVLGAYHEKTTPVRSQQADVRTGMSPPHRTKTGSVGKTAKRTQNSER